MSNSYDITDKDNFDIAVIGMACRFPGANNVDEYWENLKNGVESITFLTDAELEESGIDKSIYTTPHFVKAASIIDNADCFDAHFFGYSPREACIMDPQHRLFLEIAQEALEAAGCDPAAEYSKGHSIGVFAGSTFNTYLLNNLLDDDKLLINTDGFLLQICNDKDNLATRTSYKLNLKGPSINIQTACSTSLGAIHYAVQSLLNYDCDIALAGGVTVRVPQKNGYFYSEEMILSNDGHCRPFDSKAQGTIFGNGAGIAVLKRLNQAKKDRDHIVCVIKGSAINNDGSAKVGYTAPSVSGQAEVILKAHALTGIPFESIHYIETHGTGTILGDPIEIEALKKIFGSKTDKKAVCAIGSVKSNVGHLEAAAGIASFIKTSLCLKHKWLVPSLNFTSPNPHLQLEDSPFYVNTESKPMKSSNGSVARGCVSSFGIGGTNVHVILEQPPKQEQSSSSRDFQLLILSAKTETSLEKAKANLAEYLKSKSSAPLADIAHTLRAGRSAFHYRSIVVCKNKEEGITALKGADHEMKADNHCKNSHPKVVFMFPGQGSQYIDMAKDLYLCEPLFKKNIDRCAEILMSRIQKDIREILFPDTYNLEKIRTGSGNLMHQTRYTQPILFSLEYALAQQFIAWGIKPYAMIGHSLGEYTAACVSGVVSLEHGCSLVAQRAKLMDTLPPGSMCVIGASEKKYLDMIPEGCSLAAINAPDLTVVSGTDDKIQRFMSILEKKMIIFLPWGVIHF